MEDTSECLYSEIARKCPPVGATPAVASGPEAFGEVMDELRASLDDIGRAGFQHLAQACEIAERR